MAKPTDKDRNDRSNAPATKGSSAPDSNDRNADGNEQDSYDPVGMAGRKAGSVKNIEEQLDAEGGKGSK